ncbi:hypothetical protein [Salmonella enterica]|uniref:hypothetical protein n=1 Tax=Salmonella enterica TaxID=28901 RepID=UPI001590AFC7|nr:hypothetical protein [Salmonella enterica]
MKLSVGDIRFSESGCASTNVGVEPRELPFPICTMHVSVPLVEGKALEQYKEELLEKARERIARMYEEIIYGGDTDGEAIKPFKVEDLKIKPSELSRELIERIQNTNPTHNLEMRVALLEKRLSGKRSVHADGEAVDFYRPDGTLGVRLGNMNQQEKHPREEVLDSFLKRFRLARGHFATHSFEGFQETIKHDIERTPGVLDPIPVSIEINANSVSAALVPASSDVFRHERNDAEGSFTKVGPFNLQIQR